MMGLDHSNLMPRKVIVNPKDGFNSGFEGDKELAKKHLEIGKEYNLVEFDVGSWSSTVKLEEFPGIEFNSVHFTEITVQDELDEIVSLIMAERKYQQQKWGDKFDDENNTPYHWLGYITRYASKWAFVPNPFDPEEFKKMMVKVATLAVAAIQWTNRKYPKS